VGDAKAGAKAVRAGTKQHGIRRRAVGTRDRVIAHLAAVTEVADETGMASTRLADAVGYPGSSVAFAQLLSGMERDGLILREVRGKRTYRITLAPMAADPAVRADTARAGTVRADAVRSDTVRSDTVRADAVRPGTVRLDTVRPDTVRSDTVRAATNAETAPGGPGGPRPGQARAALPADGADLLLGNETGPAAAPGGFDYDELARRLLIQVVRRLAASPGDGPRPAAAPDQSGLEQTVAGLERELASVWTKHGTLTAENLKLREQLREAQRSLDLARERTRRLPITEELNRAEVVLLERLLSPGDEGQDSTGPADPPR